MPNQDAGFKLIFSNPELVRELLSSGLCDPWRDVKEAISYSAIALTDLWSEECPELESVQLRLQPILIDVHHLDETKLPAENNLAGLLIRIERSQDPNVAIYWIRKMNERLLEMGETSLQKSMTQWLKHYFLPTRMPELEFETCKTIEEIIMTSEHLTIDWSVPIREEGIRIGIEQGLKQGVKQGVQQGIEQGIEQGVQQGIEQGMEKGIEQGMEKGTFKILVRLLERRLGPLSPDLEEKLEEAGLKTLNRLVDVALDVESEAQVFEALAEG